MARKRRRLKNMRIGEVSLVDKPANEIPFMFRKSLDGIPIAKAGTNLKVEFETKGTAETTVLKVNGKEIVDVVSFGLFFHGRDAMPAGPNMMPEEGKTPIGLSCDYTVKAGEKNGFRQMQTFSLTKSGELRVDETEEPVPVEVDEDDAKALADAGIFAEGVDGRLAKALAGPAAIIAPYLPDLPCDLADAVRAAITIAVGTEDAPESIEDEDTVKKNEEPAKEEPTKAANQPKAEDGASLASIAASMASMAANLTALMGKQAEAEARIKVIEEAKEQQAANPEPKKEETGAPDPDDGGEDDVIEVPDDYQARLAAEAMQEVLAERTAATVS